MTSWGADSDARVQPAVISSYSNYEPPFDVSRAAHRMLDSIPEKYLSGLGEVVLTNSGDLPRKRRRSVTKSRGRKVQVAKAAGLYHPASNGNPAWIEVFVDNALRGWEHSWLLRIRFIREAKIGDVLFHEIGHHIHFTVQPEYREKEDVADIWKVRLERNYTRRQFPLFVRFMWLFKTLLGPVFERQRVSLWRRQLQTHQISRAEFQERTKSIASKK